MSAPPDARRVGKRERGAGKNPAPLSRTAEGDYSPATLPTTVIRPPAGGASGADAEEFAAR